VSIPSCAFPFNAKSPDVPGDADIAMAASDVSPSFRNEGKEQDRQQNVMAGLVPAIHALATKKDVDARHKAGHDEQERS
jgi:hypothetical protein